MTHHVCPDCLGTGDGKRDPVEGTLQCARCNGSGYGPPVLEPAREERLRTLLIDFALGAESGKRFDVEEMRCLGEDLRQMLGEIAALRTENARLAAYIERLEAANSALHLQFAAEQRERELLVEAFSLTMADAAEFHRRAEALRGRGTPRSVARIATDNTPRFVAAGATPS